MRLELLEVPVENLADFEFLVNHFFCRNTVVCRLSEAFDVWWINLFYLGCYVQARYANFLELVSRYDTSASREKGISHLQR